MPLITPNIDYYGVGAVAKVWNCWESVGRLGLWCSAGCLVLELLGGSWELVSKVISTLIGDICN